MARFSFRNGGEDRDRLQKPVFSLLDVPFEQAIPVGPRWRGDTANTIRRVLELRDAKRWRRIQEDYQWLRFQLTTMDLNPEDARFLL